MIDNLTPKFVSNWRTEGNQIKTTFFNFIVFATAKLANHLVRFPWAQTAKQLLFYAVTIFQKKIN